MSAPSWREQRDAKAAAEGRACPGTPDMGSCGSAAAEGDRYCLHCRDAIQRELAAGLLTLDEIDHAEHAANAELLREV